MCKRQGDKEKGRQGAGGALPNEPLARLVSHGDEHAEGFIVGLVKRSSLFAVQITTFDGKFEPDLRLCSLTFGIVELADEGGLVASLSPRITEVGGNRSRGAANLV